MHIYTFALQKGGTGKTSISVSIAVELAKHGRTLIIDADPQGNATDWLNITTITNELSDLLSGKCTIKNSIQKTQVKNLYIIPTAGIDGGLRSYQESRAQSEPFKIKKLMGDLEKVFDYCIIDTSPAFDALTQQTFLASDEVINVLKLDRFSQDGLKTFKVNLDKMKKNMDPSGKGFQKPLLNKLILNENNSSIKQCCDLVAEYKKLEPMGIKTFIVPIDQGFRKSQTARIPLQAIGAKTETLTALEEIAEALK